MKSYEVRFWEIRPGKAKTKRTWEVRWVVGKKESSRTYVNKEQAKNFLSDLRQAARDGEAFDTGTGLPDSMAEAVEEKRRTWFEFAQAYVLAYWPDAAAKSRDSLTDALATVTPVLVADDAGEGPEVTVMRAALRSVAFLPEGRRAEPSPKMTAALRWLRRNSLPMPELTNGEVAKKGLAALGLTLDGRKAATNTYRRKRAVFFNALQYAVELGEIEENPLTKIRAKRGTGRKTSSVKRVDRRTLVNTRQGRELITAVSYVGRTQGPMMRGLFACVYYGALRPEETAGLRDVDCDFLSDVERPWEGWGTITLAKTRPQSGKRYTDSGEAFDERGLKHRDDDETRAVPAPPVLVGILREHVKAHGTADDGRLFRTRTGKPFSYTEINRVLQGARRLALPPEKHASMLANKPYALRHAAVSTQLNAGVSPQNVAERAGHSVEVLFKVYAGCLDGDTERMNKLIEEAFGEDDG